MPSTAAASDLDSLQAIDSVRLFVVHVQAYDQDFTVEAQMRLPLSANMPSFGRLPLALEARCRGSVFTATGAIARLQERIKLLKEERRIWQGTSNARDTIAWNYRLLTTRSGPCSVACPVFTGGLRQFSRVLPQMTKRTPNIMDAVIAGA